MLLGLAYALLAVAGVRPAVRGFTIALAATLLVVLPSVAFISLGVAAERPYGQDGGVVQLPLAIDKILAGESPYGADYSGTILGRQARVSSFWDERGGNPILHHHAYLPGTHLVMAPFQLTLRRVFGFFDPRVVTLLFYALTIVLASRLPAAADARLAAAAVAGLNPLVYWHQIFGANDLLFVAMLLGAVHLGRSRPTLAGALLGLACATKQLAWPFAPFLLLVLSGAGSFRDLTNVQTWRRVARPLAATVVVFAAVVLPIAALDFQAFWGDIVVYNAGLPGADNYPLGGTPGFGFANFLIAYGHVTSLRDYFPFSIFYLLLLPLGLLLARVQMRNGTAEHAFVTGSAALLVALYFSRTVHPNYLIPAAVLLPMPLLARRRRADLAVVPLLLLAVAVEIAERGVFRSAWEQAVAAGLPGRLGDLLAGLVPSAGPQLTTDPLGLVFSATAAGLAVLFVAVGTVRGKAPTALVLGGILIVAAPVFVLARVGDRTGIIRAQDPAVVQAQADARRLVAGRSPYAHPPETTPRGRELFSASFRLDPPTQHEPLRPLLPPGPSLVAALGRVVGERDIRIPALAALAALAALVAMQATGGPRPTLLAVALVSPPLALGVSFGSPLVFALVALVGSWMAARRGRSVMAGLSAGVAVAFDHSAAFAAVPLLLRPQDPHLPAAPPPWSRPRAILAFVLGYVLLVAPVGALDPQALMARVRDPTEPGPGLGVFNLLAYWGAEASAFALALAALSPLLLAMLTLALLRLRTSGLALSGLASLVAIGLAPAAAPDAVAIPLVLLALAAADESASEPQCPREG